MTFEVRRVRMLDIVNASQVLADAFQDYPFTRWTVAEERHTDRIEALQHLALSELVLPYGEAWMGVLDGDPVTVASWLLPASTVPPERYERMAFLRKKYEGDRHAASLAAEAALEPYRPKEPAYYLAAFGTRPQHWSEGFGKRVLEPVLERIRAEHALAWVETSSTMSVRLYYALGFTVTGHLRLPGDGPETWVMQLRP